MRCGTLGLLFLVACGSPAVPEVPSAEVPGQEGHDHGAMSGHDAHEHAGHEGHAHHTAPPAADPLPGASIYRLNATFTDQGGEEVSLASLAGHPTHIAMVYTHCPSVCPRIVADMTRIEDELGEDARDVRFVLVSIDPVRDTPERLTEFAEERVLDLDRWTLLRGADRDIRMVAAALGVQYRAIAEGDYAHTNLVTLLDADGVVVHRQEGLGIEPGPAVEATRGLLGR